MPLRRTTLGALLAASMLAGCQEAPEGVRLGEIPWVRVCTSGGVDLGLQPLYFMQSFGLLDFYGAFMERVDLIDKESAFQAFMEGTCDVLYTDAATGIIAIAEGAKIKMVATPTAWRDYVIVAGPDVVELADLAGRTLAVSERDAPDHLAVMHALELEGVDPATVTFVAPGVSSSTRTAALVAGEVDAAVMPATRAVMATFEDSGLQLLYDAGDPFGDVYMGTALFARDDIIRDKRGMVQPLVDALVEANRTLADDTFFAVETAAETGLDSVVVEMAYDFLYSASKPYYAVNGGIDRALVESTVAILRQSGRLSRDVTFDEIADMRFIAQALEEQGEYEPLF